MRTDELFIQHYQQKLANAQYCAERIAPAVLHGSQMLVESLLNGGKVLIFGEGISAPIASLFRLQLIDCYKMDRPAFPAILIEQNHSMLRHEAFPDLCERQLRSLGEPGDIAIFFSGGKLTTHFLPLIKVATEKGMAIAAITLDEDNICEELNVDVSLELRLPKMSKAEYLEQMLNIANLWSSLLDHQILGAEL